MPQKILDLHIHSKYSRACSPQLELPNIAAYCAVKGIDICATGDFTHPAWFAHINETLEEVDGGGLYRLRKNAYPSGASLIQPDFRFILSTEVSCIYRHNDKTRRVHHVILAPNLAAVEKFNRALVDRGANIHSDGRPIMGISSKEILEMLLDIDPGFFLIPAHAWTPWFAIFGSKSGYDSIAECFEELSPHIRALETGLSSDPTMNRRLSALDEIVLVSNSDAHSLENLGREANVMNLSTQVGYQEIVDVIKSGDKNKFLYTIEFYPEEGMYHADGHRDCGVCLLPEETKRLKNICPHCKKPLTVGVLHRVDDLADRRPEEIPAHNFIPHKYIVPLREIIGTVLEVGVKSKRVDKEYQNLIKNLGSEFEILLNKDVKEIENLVSNSAIASAITNMRLGQVRVSPGYDGVYGTVKVNFTESPHPVQSRLI